MANYDETANSYFGYSSPSPSRSSHERPSSSLYKIEKPVEDDDAVQGRIFWLPPKQEMPEKTVRRAHGKGAVEEGIYNHPVVVISRPKDEGNIVHFHLITSFQGKKLNEIYGKSNDFHASRRSWYLPISPTPDHPDASSKKTKKRFPTLDLAGGAVLRWASYVNLRHVYKIDWRYLRSYSNPDTPQILHYRFDRESVTRLLAKGKLLTLYEAGPQMQKLSSPATPISHVPNYISNRYHPEIPSPPSDTTFVAYSDPYPCSPSSQSPFLGHTPDTPRSMQRPPRAPPDDHSQASELGLIGYIFHCILRWPWAIMKRLWALIRT